MRIHLDLLIAGKLPRIRQHSAARPSVHDLHWHTLTPSVMPEIPV
jgi:hypothetical protein